MSDVETVAEMPATEVHFGGYVRAARRSAGLSQRQLAELAEVSASTISRIEAGLTSPSFGLLRRLVAATSCSLRLVLHAPNGDELEPEDLALDDYTVWDAAGRHFPAHVDVRQPTSRRPWWFQRYNTVGAKDPLVTFDLNRGLRDLRRREDGALPWWPDQRCRFRGQQSEAYIPYYRPKPSEGDRASNSGTDLDWW